MPMMSQNKIICQVFKMRRKDIDTIYNAKKRVIQCRIEILKALKAGDLQRAASIKTESDKLRKSVLNRYGIIIE